MNTKAYHITGHLLCQTDTILQLALKILNQMHTDSPVLN